MFYRPLIGCTNKHILDLDLESKPPTTVANFRSYTITTHTRVMDLIGNGPRSAKGRK